MPTTISLTSMILAHVFAIGLSDYSRPVMLARAIVLLHPHRGLGFHIARPLVRAPWFGEPRGGERAASPAHPNWTGDRRWMTLPIRPGTSVRFLRLSAEEARREPDPAVCYPPLRGLLHEQ